LTPFKKLGFTPKALRGCQCDDQKKSFIAFDDLLFFAARLAGASSPPAMGKVGWQSYRIPV
jgi:hypothetical protein